MNDLVDLFAAPDTGRYSCFECGEHLIFADILKRTVFPVDAPGRTKRVHFCGTCAFEWDSGAFRYLPRQIFTKPTLVFYGLTR